MLLNTVIASYGAIGKASSALLQQDPYLGYENGKNASCAYYPIEQD